jgi:hypothetical protein
MFSLATPANMTKVKSLSTRKWPLIRVATWLYHGNFADSSEIEGERVSDLLFLPLFHSTHRNKRRQLGASSA